MSVEKSKSTWTRKFTELLHLYLILYPYCRNVFYRPLYIYVYIYQYALCVHLFYQLNNVLLTNLERKETPSRQTCFVPTHIWSILQLWSILNEVHKGETTRQEYDRKRRSGIWWALQQSAARLWRRYKWHDEFQEHETQYSCGRTDYDSTSQWKWDVKCPMCHDEICRDVFATYQNERPKRSITAGQGVTWPDVQLEYFQTDNKNRKDCAEVFCNGTRERVKDDGL